MALLPEKTVKDKAMELTSIEYETEQPYPDNYGMTAGDSDGQGISHGCIQFPLGWGTLQNIWKDLYTNYFNMVKSKFTLAADFTIWEDWLWNKTIQQQIAYASSDFTDWANDSTGHLVKQPWKTYFHDLGITPESQLRQQQEVDVVYHPNALTWFKDFGLWTRRGYALMFDISVQNGSINPLDVNQQPIDVMGRIFTRFAGLSTAGMTAEQIETEKMKLIVEERAKEVSATWRPSYIERKNSIALGELYLVAWGKTVSTVPYDMILEPAFAGYTKADLYVATDGDTFASIAQQYNTTGAKIQEMNPQVVDTNIYTGLSFNVPYQEVVTNTGIFLGSGSVNKIFIGGTEINKIYSGSALVYTPYIPPVAPTTTISPTNTIQNTIPFTVTLSTDEVGATIYYKLGATGTQQTYTAPFPVNQTSAGVYDVPIKVTYWAVGAGATEAEKSITYDTSGSIPAAPNVTATASAGQVALSWAATANTTSYTIYRSTASGTLGTILAGTQYMTATNWTDTTVTNGTTYYYTVQAGNYANPTNSAQKAATPVAAPSGWRYLKIQGYGASEAGQEVTTRMIEFEAWEGATNRMAAATILSGETPSNSGTGGTLAQIKDTVKGSTSNTYPFWWTATPNANIVIDLGAVRALTKLNYYGYSLNGIERANRFNVLASNTNNGTDWVNIWDMQANATLQPILPNGYEKIL